ncbi:MAG: hypothetical protein A3H32_06780 [Betaproteobacteria bacterium RIFCSPLOWO2_02_FULL_63_19]|nr:MAG: hypothetical protein A3H32_06780 [Betaproteobacteria bacterium RIFCSPLOWO2_02_FULL_63_19]
MDQQNLLARITVDPRIFGGKPIVRGRRLAVEHVLGMLAAGDTPQSIVEAYPWLEQLDVQACLVYARRVVGHERVEPFIVDTAE